MSDQPPPQDPEGPQRPDGPQGPEGQQPGWGQAPGWGQQPGWGQPQQSWGQQPPPFPPQGPPGFGPPSFSATDAVGYGWRKFFANPGPFVGITALIVLAGGSINFVGGRFGNGPNDFDSAADIGLVVGLSIVGFVFSLVAQVVATMLSAAAIRGALDVVEGQPVSFGAMFERWDKLQVLVAALLITVVSAVGFALCILPGFVVVFLTWFANYFIVGGGRSAIDGITESVRFASAHLGGLLLLALLSVLVCLAGLLACLVGLLVAIPVVTIASAYAFRELHGLPAAP